MDPGFGLVAHSDFAISSGVLVLENYYLPCGLSITYLCCCEGDRPGEMQTARCLEKRYGPDVLLETEW